MLRCFGSVMFNPFCGGVLIKENPKNTHLCTLGAYWGTLVSVLYKGPRVVLVRYGALFCFPLALGWNSRPPLCIYSLLLMNFILLSE